MVVARTILFKDDETEIAPISLRHELVHIEQMDRHGIARFYLIYLCDYLANLGRLRDHDAAYRHILFEREARERAICDDVTVKRPEIDAGKIV
jgi:hypothetical protein